jgi:hypothetical protein
LQYRALRIRNALLVVATVRAEEEQDNPPLGRLVAQLERTVWSPRCARSS